ncbi:MAG: apolipoprotein N-acyltransferase, partial [Deltaproteobacteria bacterium]
VRVDGKLGWNSVALIGGFPLQQIIYDKHHLVPFGEYIPFPWLLERIGLRRMTVGEGYGYVEGPGPTVVDIPGLGKTLILICYEAVFPQDLVTPGVRPQVIVHLTNDGWFGTFSGPYQHLDQVRLRAIELGLPVIRAANTGVSAVIDPYGRVRDQLRLGTKGVLDYPVPQALPPTLYARTHDLPMMILTILLLLVAALTRRKRLTL